MTPGGSIAGLILAGGASRRMGRPKALLRFQNETFLDRMIRLFALVCDPVIVVLGHNAPQIRAGLESPGAAVFTVNPDPERGMLSSLRCGLAAMPASAAAVLFAPVDHPHLQASTLQALASKFQAARAPVTVPVYAGEHGHPVCIARALVDELLALPETAMASDVIHRYVNATCYFEVDDPAVVTDIDDPAAYAGLMAAQESPRLP
ncbi:MAG TPA: nucleotidyltransferase family protein [Bryobacteraceae bacterium]|nr:nucleotidyltransferase family protein [Bryobacteraceae bacterium]